MNFITKYQNYFIIILISLIFGLARWSFLDIEFPLIGWSELQKKTMRIKELSEKNIGSNIDFQLMKKIVADQVFYILDARDIDSYNEGHITGSINFDSELIVNENEKETNELFNFLDTLTSNRIIIYCWSPECTLAEDLSSFLIYSELVKESNISIYTGGWDEWSSFYNK